MFMSVRQCQAPPPPGLWPWHLLVRVVVYKSQHQHRRDTDTTASASALPTMIPLVVFSLLVAGVASQHPAHVEFDPNALISQLHAQFSTTEVPVVNELPQPVRGMPQRPIRPASIQRPIQQRLAQQQVQKDFLPVHLQADARPIAQLPGHLANQMARIQVPKPGPHRFSSPKSKVPKEGLTKKWEGPFAHEFGAGVKGPVEHTQFTPEVAAAHKFLTQAHVNHFRQKAQIDAVKVQGEQQHISSTGGRSAGAHTRI